MQVPGAFPAVVVVVVEAGAAALGAKALEVQASGAFKAEAVVVDLVAALLLHPHLLLRVGPAAPAERGGGGGGGKECLFRSWITLLSSPRQRVGLASARL